MKKILNSFLLLILGYFIYGIIFGKNGLVYNRHITNQIAEQVKINQELAQQNVILIAKVNDLKNANYDAYNSYIRRNLDYMLKDEVFFRVINSPTAPLFYNKDDINPFIPNPKEPIINIDLNKLRSKSSTR